MLFESLLQKMKKIYFSIFNFFIIFFCKSNSYLKFFVGICIVIEIAYAKSEENLFMKLQFMQTFPTKAPRNLWDA